MGLSSAHRFLGKDITKAMTSVVVGAANAEKVDVRGMSDMTG